MALQVHALACAFGLGSWVAVNGLWVELPLLVGVLPEGWALPSYLTVIIQLANVGPLAVTLAHRLCPGALREAPVIAGVLAVGVLACALLAAFWRRTNCILGQERSSAFLALTFFLALVDCTSSVTFLPFMMQLPARYVSSYFIGEGLSGFLPGLLALAQGVGVARCVNASEPPTNPNASQGLALQAEYHPLAGQGLALQTEYHPLAGQGLALQTEYLAPSFSPEAFFVLLAVMTSVSLLAFILLRRLPHTYQLSAEHLVSSEGVSSEGVSSEGVPVPAVCVGVEPLGVGGGDPAKGPPGAEERGQRRPLLAKRGYSGAQQAFIYAMVVWANSATNGLLPSVQTYSCMPYGSLAYHLSAALASLANPLACIIAMLRPQR
ncbi:hypothetical protein ACEWY4_028138 [Coilia grayii]|uniref:Riboflavin transporter n=1 Tax=Coilia grayii TaxID=363190 RepID=A0ABD1IMM6_9TELE